MGEIGNNTSSLDIQGVSGGKVNISVDGVVQTILSSSNMCSISTVSVINWNRLC